MAMIAFEPFHRVNIAMMRSLLPYCPLHNAFRCNDTDWCRGSPVLCYNNVLPRRLYHLDTAPMATASWAICVQGCFTIAIRVSFSWGDKLSAVLPLLLVLRILRRFKSHYRRAFELSLYWLMVSFCFRSLISRHVDVRCDMLSIGNNTWHYLQK